MRFLGLRFIILIKILQPACTPLTENFTLLKPLKEERNINLESCVSELLPINCQVLMLRLHIGLRVFTCLVHTLCNMKRAMKYVVRRSHAIRERSVSILHAVSPCKHEFDWWCFYNPNSTLLCWEHVARYHISNVQMFYYLGCDVRQFYEIPNWQSRKNFNDGSLWSISLHLWGSDDVFYVLVIVFLAKMEDVATFPGTRVFCLQ